jgi:hypothetical protein
VPTSWLLTFTDGSDQVTAPCFPHGAEQHAAGWYAKSERALKLSKPFKMP